MEDRFARQRIIPGWDQDRLGAATVVVAGVGALGNEVAKNLALAGIGRLVLCDPDVVSVSNLSRTVLLGAGDVGRPKGEVAAASLRELVPGLVAEARVADLAAGVGLGELADADAVVSCVDTIRARMRLLGRCALVDAALVDGGTHPWGGEVRLRLSPDEACYGCTLSAHDRGVSDLPWSCFGTAPDGPQPAGIATTALVASWMTIAVLRVLFGEPPGYRVLSVDAVGGRTAPVIIDRDPDCPHHRPLPGQVEPIPVSSQNTVSELLKSVDVAEEPLTWGEFPLPRRCHGCGDYAGGQIPHGETNGEISAEGVTACGRCGALLRPRYGRRLREADPRARLSELGVAPQDILPVRLPGGEYACRRLSP